jgi:hypothetical protein
MLTAKPWFEEISMERAYEEIEKLTDQDMAITDGSTVYRGIHPEHGDIRIVINPIGNPLILFFPL